MWNKTMTLELLMPAEVGQEPRQWLGDLALVTLNCGQNCAFKHRCSFSIHIMRYLPAFSHVCLHGYSSSHASLSFFVFFVFTSHCLGASLLHQLQLHRLWTTEADSCRRFFYLLIYFLGWFFSLCSCVSCHVGEKTTRRTNWDRRAHSRVRGRVQSLKRSEEKKQKKSLAVSPRWMV